ncbi:hypothetical protein HPB47_027407 [Ixodes persulcatus]|uniref:Uncharacterized protein n=1 Tax=Ixodes persulcatus TaxID=34615 RepID=A0AC60PVY1_IXOPE|nr:hypothetical protein HPB47_027407 [Ixodes persulcatus]
MPSSSEGSFGPGSKKLDSDGPGLSGGLTRMLGRDSPSAGIPRRPRRRPPQRCRRVAAADRPSHRRDSRRPETGPLPALCFQNHCVTSSPQYALPE